MPSLDVHTDKTLIMLASASHLRSWVSAAEIKKTEAASEDTQAASKTTVSYQQGTLLLSDVSVGDGLDTAMQQFV